MLRESSVSDLIQCLRFAKRRLLGPDWKKKTESAEALGKLRATEAVGDLIAVIDEKENTDLCRMCVKALGQIGNASAIQGLARLLTLPDRQDVHAEAVLTLAQIENEDAAQALVQVSADSTARRALVDGLRQELRKATHLMIPDWDRRAMAAEALGKLHAAEAVGDMVEGLSRHKESRLWAATIPALTLIGDDRAAAALVSGWQWADATQVAAIGQSLRSLGTERTDQLLVDGLSHESPVVREQAWELLAETGILPRLISALEDPNEEVHLRAKRQAVQVGQRAVSDLFAALHHEAGQVRRLAALALLEIGGKGVEPLRSVLSLWGQAAETPRSTAEATDGSGDFFTVQEAVASAPSAGIINVARGKYHLGSLLNIDKPLALVGAGMDDSRIMGEATKVLVQFSGNGPFCAVGLSFENTGCEAASVVEVAGGEVGLYRCRFTGGSVGDQDLVGPTGESADRTVDTILFEDMQGPILPRVPESPVGGDGLRLLASARGTVSQCESVRNAKVGILAIGEAAVRLEGNVCRENWAGIMLHDSVTCTVAQNRCSANHLHGIQITGRARVEVRDSICDENGKAGILVGDEARPSLVGNTCRANRVGVAFKNQATGNARQNKCFENGLAGVIVQDNALPSLQENICQSNTLSGIAYYDSAAGPASQNQCIENGTNGIKVAGTARPALQTNTCSRNSIVGIVVVEGGQPTLEGNTCDENQDFGIAVTDSARPSLHRNLCRRNTVGLHYEGQSAGTATKNQLNENKWHGVQVQDQAQPTLEENTCRQNTGYGIAYRGSASGTVRQNECLGNGEAGILLLDHAEPSVTENICRENQVNGVEIAECSTARLYRNQCSSNARHGIQVGDEAVPIIEENDCRENAGSGIFYADLAAGAAQRNRCINNEQIGILLFGDLTDPQLIDNVCRGNKLGQIYRKSD